MKKPEKGASSRAQVSAAHKAELEAGRAQSRTLSELLVMDLQQLLKAVAPETAEQGAINPAAGITLRMQTAAAALYASYGDNVFARFGAHSSDTVRGFAAYCVPLVPNLNSEQILAHIRQFANDPHFGVREWAWLAVRAKLAADLHHTIPLLAQWARDPSAHIRRFASEVLRPRGVWCTHIAQLKQSPELALSILELLRADPERYVQDSVANWLNDASKTQSDWVLALCQRWRAQSTTAATAYICRRATRSLVKS